MPLPAVPKAMPQCRPQQHASLEPSPEPAAARRACGTPRRCRRCATPRRTACRARRPPGRPPGRPPALRARRGWPLPRASARPRRGRASAEGRGRGRLRRPACRTSRGWQLLPVCVCAASGLARRRWCRGRPRVVRDALCHVRHACMVRHAPTVWHRSWIWLHFPSVLVHATIMEARWSRSVHEDCLESVWLCARSHTPEALVSPSASPGRAPYPRSTAASPCIIANTPARPA